MHFPRVRSKSLFLPWLVAVQMLWAASLSLASETAPTKRIGCTPFELSFHTASITAVLKGVKPGACSSTTDDYSQIGSIAKGIHSLTFFFKGDPLGYPMSLDASDLKSEGFSPVNVFAIKEFAILPKQGKSKRNLVRLEHLQEHLRGDRQHPEHVVNDFDDYLLRGLPEDEINTAQFQFELYYPGVTAIFHGLATGVFPLQYGVDSLSFLFPHTEEEFKFQPTGTLYKSDWKFDLMSPDQHHMLLLQSHYGPYHIVSVERLKQYLTGYHGPDYEIDWTFPESGLDSVLSEGSWLDSDLISFDATCCGTRESLIYRLGSVEGPKPRIDQ